MQKWFSQTRRSVEDNRFDVFDLRVSRKRLAPVAFSDPTGAPVDEWPTDGGDPDKL
jgi:hypothetical protein